ncbi:MAG: GNAT family N-acetyltransferase [Proteobacteria bacterium]|nr:GNAT family N-acetyltransferase [Pseudomonadota bacterium]
MSELRRLGPGDFESCYALRLRALKEEPTAFCSTYDEEKADGGAMLKRSLAAPGEDDVVFGALEGGAVVAMTGIYRGKGQRERHKGQVWGVFVDSAFREKKLGGKLLDLCVAQGRTLGLRLLNLTVKGGGAPARKLYASRGFKTWGLEPQGMWWEGKFFDEEHMSLFL